MHRATVQKSVPASRSHFSDACRGCNLSCRQLVFPGARYEGTEWNIHNVPVSKTRKKKLRLGMSTMLVVYPFENHASWVNL